MEEIEITKYLKVGTYTVGRKGYNPVNLLKTILFGFMDKRYISLREPDDECQVNIRYMYLMDYETPSYRTFCNFINDCLSESIEDIFKAINEYIIKKNNVDLNHLYIVLSFSRLLLRSAAQEFLTHSNNHNQLMKHHSRRCL